MWIFSKNGLSLLFQSGTGEDGFTGHFELLLHAQTSSNIDKQYPKKVYRELNSKLTSSRISDDVSMTADLDDWCDDEEDEGECLIIWSVMSSHGPSRNRSSTDAIQHCEI